MVMVAQAGNTEQAVAEFRRHRPDVTLMDLSVREAEIAGAVTANLLKTTGRFPLVSVIASEPGVA